MKKKIALFLALITFALMFTGSMSSISATTQYTEDTLIIVGNKTVTKHMTDKDVINLFGEPKLKTPSPFGGYYYTFFGDNYGDYLYIETTETGAIAAYGSVGEGFRSSKYSFGDINSKYSGGTVAKEKNDSNEYVLYGFIKYNQVSKLSAKEYNYLLATKKYTYLPSISQHMVHMFNALSVNYGYNTPIYYDEETTNYILQLSDSNMDVCDYTNNLNLSGYVKRTSHGKDINYDWDYQNPLKFAKTALGYSIGSDKRAIAYSYFYDGEYYRDAFACVNPSLFNRSKIDFTEEEKEKIYSMSQMYANSVNKVNNAGGYFEIAPQYTTLPLTGGKIKNDVLEGSTEYLNVIRYGADLPLLTHNEQLSEAAQAKATYSMYFLNNDIYVDNPHTPPQLDGVDDDFYKLTQKGSAENLYDGNTITSIRHALDDIYGDPIDCGHRYALLSPYFSEIGLGSASDQGVHKFDGYQESNYDFISWPSNGVTPIEAIWRSTFVWTIKANTEKYKFTPQTEVHIKCLNNGKEWHIDRNNKQYYPSPGLLSFYDDSLSVSTNDIYEITVTNVCDVQTNKQSSISYRSVIASVYGSSTSVNSISLSDTTLNGFEGESYLLKATISPDNASDPLTIWESSDPDIAEVTSYGKVTFKSKGVTTITATTYDGKLTATCTVVVKEISEHFIGDIDLDGTITIKDATLLQKHIANITTLTEEQLKISDTNRDGSINISDCTQIQKFLTSIITSL